MGTGDMAASAMGPRGMGTGTGRASPGTSEIDSTLPSFEPGQVGELLGPVLASLNARARASLSSCESSLIDRFTEFSRVALPPVLVITASTRDAVLRSRTVTVNPLPAW